MSKQLARIENQYDKPSNSILVIPVSSLKALKKLEINKNITRNLEIGIQDLRLPMCSLKNEEDLFKIIMSLDGLSKQAKLDLTCQMSTAGTAYKTKGCLDKSVTIVIQGFTRQLKGLWNNLCIENGRNMILNNVKQEN
ncbi:hypothetical protein CR513_60696, partial [Mucuna pruriens]